MEDFDECIDLMNSGSVDMQESFSLLVDAGTPIFTAHVDWDVAEATGHGVVLYKLHDKLLACLLACRARGIHANHAP